jgi:PD-(D/E)XK nuclease superfamily
MNADKLNPISRTIIGQAFVVSNTLDAGFLLSGHEYALTFELREVGLEVKQYHDIAVRMAIERLANGIRWGNADWRTSAMPNLS